jgi:hypothetical protein
VLGQLGALDVPVLLVPGTSEHIGDLREALGRPAARPRTSWTWASWGGALPDHGGLAARGAHAHELLAGDEGCGLTDEDITAFAARPGAPRRPGRGGDPPASAARRHRPRSVWHLPAIRASRPPSPARFGSSAPSTNPVGGPAIAAAGGRSRRGLVAGALPQPGAADALARDARRRPRARHGGNPRNQERKGPFSGPPSGLLTWVERVHTLLQCRKCPPSSARAVGPPWTSTRASVVPVATSCRRPALGRPIP